MASGCISGEPQSLPQAWQCSARAAGAGGLAPGCEEGKAAGLAEGARGAGAEGGQEGCACRAQAERGASQRAKARA